MSYDRNDTQQADTFNLIEAAAAGDVKSLEQIWLESNASACDTYGRRFALWATDAEEYCTTTALHQAVIADSVECVTWLLDNGAEINLVDLHGRSPLAVAAAFGNAIMLELLHSRGASVMGGPRTCPNAYETQIGCPLHNAANTNILCMQLLLSFGARASQQGESRYSLLHAASAPELESVLGPPLPGPTGDVELLCVPALEPPLPRVVLALEALQAAAGDGVINGDMFPGQAEGGDDGGVPIDRCALDHWINNQHHNMRLSVPAALALLGQNTRSPGSWWLPGRIQEAPPGPHNGVSKARPLLQAASVCRAYIQLPNYFTTGSVCDETFRMECDGGHRPQQAASAFSAPGQQCMRAASSVLVWAMRYPPMARLAAHYGLTQPPLYPCESQSTPFQARRGAEWDLQTSNAAAWHPGGNDRAMVPLPECITDRSWNTRISDLNPGTVLVLVLLAVPFTLTARYGDIDVTAAAPHEGPASRFTRLLRARDDTWTSHLPCISAQDVQRCLVCFAAAVRHVCEVDSSLLPEVCARPVLAALLCWGWNARGRRSLVLRRASMRA